MTIAEMRDIDIRDIDPAVLVDIGDVRTDPALPTEVRMREFLRQIKNPYCVRVGAVKVKLSFTGDASLADRLKSAMTKA